MENGEITAGKISASSQYSANHGASQGRLHLQPNGAKAGSWSPAINDVNQWLQVDLITIFARLSRVATQGSNDMDQWVTQYNLDYGDDGVNFQYYREYKQNENKVSLTN